MPLHIIRIESIGDDAHAALRAVQQGRAPVHTLARIHRIPPEAWIAELSLRAGRIERRRLSPHRDYSQANGPGSRGIFLEYQIEEHKVYEISAPETWSRVDQYFALHDGRGLRRLSRAEAYSLVGAHYV